MGVVNHSTFVGLVPADKPRLVVLVSVIGANSELHPTGGSVAAPSFARLAEVAMPLAFGDDC